MRTKVLHRFTANRLYRLHVPLTESTRIVIPVKSLVQEMVRWIDIIYNFKRRHVDSHHQSTVSSHHEKNQTISLWVDVGEVTDDIVAFTHKCPG
ncbi:hypothetical protein F2P81_003386 [Scophthalmus maximus]|uniref:Uncharacterized protein n=1 Tax=Scophthalmus maximus TaxID=52904 RepID=A0A6A4TIB9_SCOMX|nr:hypothetical protein F2P81_003386 [Scophthalmus maximus]